MITKIDKQKILETIKDKEDKILVSSILDKAIRFEKTDSPYCSSFLNINEMNIVKNTLNHFKVRYYTFCANEYCEKSNIAFIPDYLIDNKDAFFASNICCIKIISNSKGKLLHKDYMGAIYSLGVKREYIGDIILKNDVAYFFCLNCIKEYFMLNLISVGKYNVITEEISIYSKEVQELSLNLIEKEYIVSSYRIDAILSEVYNLSRSETKDKILNGDLYINDKNIFYPNTIVKKEDIVSFKRCGKIRIGKELRKTRNNNIVIVIYKYS